MAQNSTIEWTESTWNPIGGCSAVSPGCVNCYAARMTARFGEYNDSLKGLAIMDHKPLWTGNIKLFHHKLDIPLEWKTPKVIFVNSMSDLFHEGVPDNYIEAVIRVMAAADWHTYQVLTKRSKRMSELLSTKFAWAARYRHIWWGVSVEDKKYGVPRIEHLRSSDVAVRFLSIEPLIEDVGILNLTGIHWAIIGGESGPNARPMEKDWVKSLHKQCNQADVPFFFKQWGGVRKKEAGRSLYGRFYNAMPVKTDNPVPPKWEKEQLKLHFWNWHKEQVFPEMKKTTPARKELVKIVVA